MIQLNSQAINIILWSNLYPYVIHCRMNTIKKKVDFRQFSKKYRPKKVQPLSISGVSINGNFFKRGNFVPNSFISIVMALYKRGSSEWGA